MTGKVRVLNTLENKKVDRFPWVPYIGVHGGMLINANATDFLMNKELLVKGLLKAHELYKPDGMSVVFDLQIEAEILGCELKWGKDSPPSVKSHPFSEDKSFDKKLVFEVKENQGRLPIILEAMDELKIKIGGTTALYGLVCGPFTLASHLRGERFLMDIVLHEDYVKDLLIYTTNIVKQMIDIYEKHGMDIIAIVDPLVSQISPKHFKLLCAEPFSSLFSHIRSLRIKSSFFVCGNATKQLECLCQTKPDSIGIDENVDVEYAKGICQKYGITIAGNIPVTTLLLHGSLEEIEKYILNLSDKANNGLFILSPGCDIVYDTPPKNIIKIREMVSNLNK